MRFLPEPQIRVPATLEAVRDLAAALQAACADARVDEAIAFELELALVEAANNIVEHGFRGAEGEIGLTVTANDEAVRVVLTDNGPPAPAGMFDAAAAPADPLAEEGRGLMILQSCVDTIAYESAGGINTLTLTRSLAAG